MPETNSRVVLHLRIRAATGKREELLNFLHFAIPFYEQPGGIRVRVLQDARDPDAFIEIVEYESWEKYREDERRVESDPTMGAYLQKWRTLLLEPPVVEVYGELSLRASIQPSGWSGGTVEQRFSSNAAIQAAGCTTVWLSQTGTASLL